MRNLIKIALYTLLDQMRLKSFYVLLGVSILFVLHIRTCYGGRYIVQGQQVDRVTVAWHASKIAFHVICCGMFLLTALLAMRVFTRDRNDGSLVLFLSRPVDRWQYVFGRVGGIWILSSLFMFVLHCTIFLIAMSKTGGVIPGYLLASTVCFINLLFTTLLVCLLSLYMPDFIAALATVGIVAVGFISDGMHLLMQNKMIQDAFSGKIHPDPAWWRIIYPKVSLVQRYAVSLIDKSEFHGMGPVHPVLNVIFFSVIIAGILYVVFNRREI